jgi:hypothetical protein
MTIGERIGEMASMTSRGTAGDDLPMGLNNGRFIALEWIANSQFPIADYTANALERPCKSTMGHGQSSILRSLFH